MRIKRPGIIFGSAGAAFLCLSLGAFGSAAQKLELAGNGEAGDLTVQVTGAPEAVTALQFDLQYNCSACDLQVSIARSAEQAGKAVQTASPEPNRLRVLVFGFNRTVISNGPVVSIRAVDRGAGGSTAPVPIRISGVAATDGAGNSLEIAGPEFPVEVRLARRDDR